MGFEARPRRHRVLLTWAIRWLAPVALFLATAAPLAGQAPFSLERVTNLSRTIYPRVVARTQDGRTWFANERFTPHTIGYFTTDGAVTEFPIPCGECATHTNKAYVEWMTTGPDGNVWFIWTHVRSDGAPLNGGVNSFVSKVSPAGQFTTFAVQTRDAFRRYFFGATGISTITTGPDGNLWFTEYPADKVGRITPEGTITEFALESFSSPSAIAAGSDGNLWFTQPGKGRIGRITPSGTLAHFTVGPTIGTGAASPYGLASTATGELWFTDRDGKVGSITTAGTVTRFTVFEGNVRTLIARGRSNDFYFPAARSNGTPLLARLRPSQLTAAGIGSLLQESRAGRPPDAAAGPASPARISADSPAISVASVPSGITGMFQVLVPEFGPSYVTAFLPDASAGGNPVDLLLKLTLEGNPCPSIVTEFLPEGTINETYSATLAAAGGSGNYKWTADGLPAGFTMTESGVLTGSRGTQGSFELTITLTDRSQPECAPVTTRLVLVINAKGSSTSANRPTAPREEDPVDVTTGELVEKEPADLDLGGPLPLLFRREYAAALARDRQVTSALGRNWMHNFDLSLRASADSVTFVDHGGKVVRFTGSGTSWQLDGAYDIPYQLVRSGQNWVVGDPVGERVLTFDGDGRLTAVEDGRGNVHTLSYSSSRLATVSDGLGRTITFSYDSGGRLTSVSDGQRSVSFAYTGDLLTAVTNPLGQTTRYEYTTAGSIAGLMTRKIERAGNVRYVQEFDSQGRVTRQRGEQGETTFTYGAGETTLRDPAGATRTHVFSASSKNAPAGYRDELGKARSMEADAAGRPTAMTERSGDAYRLAYSPQCGLPASYLGPDGGQAFFEFATRTYKGVTLCAPAKVTHPDGGIERWEFDANGNPVVFFDQAGHRWTATWNGRGQAETVTNPEGGVIRYTYNADGTLATASDPDVLGVRFGYDTLKRPTSITYPDEAAVRFEWDAGDRLTAVTDERGARYRIEYDANDQPVAITDPNGRSTTITWDVMGRVKTRRDRTGATTTFGWNAVEELASITDATSRSVAFRYDSRRLLSELVDSAGSVWKVARDDDGVLRTVTDPANAATTVERTPTGHLSAVTDALGNRVMLTRDLMRRPTRYTSAVGRHTDFTWDKRGLLTSVSNGAISASTNFNPLGLIERIHDPNRREWLWSWTPGRRLRTITDPLGRTTAFHYDVRGRLSRVSYGDGTEGRLTRDATGNVTRVDHPGGVSVPYAWSLLGEMTSTASVDRSYDAESRISSSNSAGVAITYARDAAGRLTSVTVGGSLVVNYEYDAAGRLSRASDALSGTSVSFDYDAAGRVSRVVRPGVTTDLTRDAAGRLTRIRHGSAVDLRYTLDASGRVTREDRTGTLPPPAAMVESTTAYDGASQPAGTGHQSDARGRVTSLRGTAVQWDGGSRLTALGSTTFSYDGLGRAIGRASASGSGSLHYADAISSRALVLETREGAPVRYYVWSPGGKLLYSIDAATRVASHHLFDRTGSTVALADAAGTVTDSWTYDPFGVVIARSGSSAQPFTYGGEHGTQALGGDLYRMGERIYDATLARFLTPDRVRSNAPNAINPYQYALGNPLLFSDPAGTNAQVVQSGVHTDITVDVWEGDKVVGTVNLSFAADGFEWNKPSTYLGAVAGTAQIAVDVKWGQRVGGSQRMPDGSVHLTVVGSREQDERLAAKFLDVLGIKDESITGLMRRITANPKLRKPNYSKKLQVFKPGLNRWFFYSMFKQTCNDFTDAMLDEYFGFDWQLGRPFVGEWLIDSLMRFTYGTSYSAGPIRQITGEKPAPQEQE